MTKPLIWAQTLASQIVRKWFAPLLLFTLMWAVLARAQPESWVIGIPSILLASFAFIRLRHSHHLQFNVKKLPGFLLWFLWNSLRGGIDVAHRALCKDMPLEPGFFRYHINTPKGPVRVFFINCLSLLPGTLSADIEDNELVVHALDMSMDIFSDTREVERRVLTLFNQDIIDTQVVEPEKVDFKQDNVNE